MNVQKKRRFNTNVVPKANRLTAVLFFVYLLLLCWILLFKLGVPFANMGGKRHVNLTPFGAPLMLNGKADFGEVVLNVMIFVPLGVYAGMLFRTWHLGKKLFLFFLLSFTCEALQYIFKIGASDITDIITNTSGGLIGLLIFSGVEKAFTDSSKAQRFVNIVATAVTILVVLLLALLKLNMLPVRYQ